MATRRSFAELIRRFCEYCGLADPERVVRDGLVVVDQIVFSLIYNEKLDHEMLFVYSDYGRVPRGRELEVYRALLQANMHLYTGHGPMLGLSSEGDRVIRADLFRLADLKPQALYATMVELAASAKAWRRDPLAMP